MIWSQYKVIKQVFRRSKYKKTDNFINKNIKISATKQTNQKKQKKNAPKIP